MADNKKKSYIKLLIRLRPVLKWLFTLRGSSKAIAGGLSLGMFIAFTPTIGFQVILAALFATIFNLNRPAAILTVWITNPVTIPVIFTFNYWVGIMIFPGPPVSDVASRLLEFVKQMASFDIWQVLDQFTAFMHLGKEVLIPLATLNPFLGSIALLASFAGAFVMSMIAYRQIGGQTGDVLGSVQQISELFFLIAMATTLS